MQPDMSAKPRLCVVGTGALGSALLGQLREQRFASVLLVDPDAVEERNLVLSPLLRRAVDHLETSASQKSGARQNKAELLAVAAQELDGLRWRSASCEIADAGWADLREVDLLCCCTDSVLSRVETAWIARALGKPMLDGAVVGQEIAGGRVTIFPPAEAAACFLCGLAESRRAAVLGYAASTSLGCQAPESVPAMAAALATLNAVAAEMLRQILDWQQLASEVSLASKVSHSTRLALGADDAWQTESFELSRSATCPWHDAPSAMLEELAWEEPLATVLRDGARELVLNWPVCTEAVCEACGVRTRPMQRVAQVRRSPCAACGCFQQQPLRAIFRVRHGDPYSGCSPRQLGMPARHLYWMRDTDQELSPQEVAV
ncbi:ThiF family adenylyltransferase [Terriglobus sp.]|uniref:ThiF family adenylyltransferase n=1 Tax=Terriglobus sp. TaxID=1889013 RepID=UPI003B0050B3